MQLLVFSQQNIPFIEGDDERLIVEQWFFASGAYYMVFVSISQTIICYNLLEFKLEIKQMEIKL